MSNETVEVPVEALRQMQNWFSGEPTDYAPGSGLPVLLAVEVPEPLKVGDTITGEQFAALPPLSVAIDYDGDVWVHTGGGATLTQAEGTEYLTADYYLASDLGHGTLVHIGEEVN